MKLKTSVRYAIRIIFTLIGLSKPVSIACLSEKTGIAPRAIELTHAVLKRHGFTTGAIGSKGGIMLAAAPAEITLGRLAEIFGDGVELSVCSGKKTNECSDRHSCAMRSVWDELSRGIQHELNSISLEKIFQEYVEKPSDAVRKAKCIP